MKKPILFVLILIISVCSGCLYLPIIYTKSGAGSVDPSFIIIGLTTKEDVILRCGAPWKVQDSVVLDDEKMISYRWDTFGGIWIFSAGYGSGAMGAVDRTTHLVIDFDENDVVKSYDIDRDTKLRQW